MDKKITSKSHPAHYLMHKYWGRKAHNLVAAYINHYTDYGDIVLDPFMGSGGVVIESKKLGRKSIGVDINPITKLIVESTLAEVNPEDFIQKFESIVFEIPEEVRDLSFTICPICGAHSLLLNAVWEKNELTRVKGHCVTHKTFVKNSEEFDLMQIITAEKLLKKYEKKPTFYYPKTLLLDFVRRNGMRYMHDLFTVRNLLQSALILEQINLIKNKNIRGLYQLAFTSMLPNVSNMIPADTIKVTGKSGWQISKFWVPSIHTEKNVFISFETRVKKIYTGKKEVIDAFSEATHTIKIANSEKLKFISANSIDYIFTDPPYGDSIAYLGLSMFWNSWLEYSVDYESEIIYDPYRNKTEADYKMRLHNVYGELYRVLKPGKHMSFTFHNRKLKFWKIIMDAVIDHGFILDHVTWQPQAVASGTQGINRKNTLKGDFVYTFIKPSRNPQQKLLMDSSGEDMLIKIAEDLIVENGFLETPILYENAIPILVQERAFLDNKGKILDIDKILSEHFRYNMRGGNYGWTK